MKNHKDNPWGHEKVGEMRDERNVYQCPTTGNIYWIEAVRRYVSPRDVDFKRCGKG